MFLSFGLEKTFECPMDCKEIQPVHPEGNQFSMFIGRADVEAETIILWPSDVKSWLIWIRPWCWERLRAGGDADDRGWDGLMSSPTLWTWVWMDSRELVIGRESWPAVVYGVAKSRTQLSDELTDPQAIYWTIISQSINGVINSTDFLFIHYP